MIKNIEIKAQLRPCIINGEHKALFHMWEQVATSISSGGQISYVRAIVELETGTVIRTPIDSVRFVDGAIYECCFPPEKLSDGGVSNE